jgi:hypothetical protein
MSVLKQTGSNKTEPGINDQQVVNLLAFSKVQNAPGLLVCHTQKLEIEIFREPRLDVSGVLHRNADPARSITIVSRMIYMQHARAES